MAMAHILMAIMNIVMAIMHVVMVTDGNKLKGNSKNCVAMAINHVITQCNNRFCYGNGYYDNRCVDMTTQTKSKSQNRESKHMHCHDNRHIAITKNPTTHSPW